MGNNGSYIKFVMDDVIIECREAFLKRVDQLIPSEVHHLIYSPASGTKEIFGLEAVSHLRSELYRAFHLVFGDARIGVGMSCFHGMSWMKVPYLRFGVAWDGSFSIPDHIIGDMTGDFLTHISIDDIVGSEHLTRYRLAVLGGRSMR